MKILTADAMREVDRRAIEELGVPSLVLMENAAIGLADAVCREYPDAGSAAIFCGPGNNGGDGLALARHLAVRGFHVQAFLATGGRVLRGDAAVQQRIHEALGLPLAEIATDEDVGLAAATARDLDLVVDAVFGVGLTRPLEGRFEALVRVLNDLPVPRVAVDLPSGLDGSRFDIPGPCFEAELTVTFGAAKVAHVLSPAADVVGRVIVASLGVPDRLVEEAAGSLHLLVGAELADMLAPRPATAHKGDFGHAVLLSGSVGKSGAAILAARAAVRCGAGLVTVAAPEEIVQTVDLGSVESMTLPLRKHADGGLDDGGARGLLEFCRDKSVLAIGPGLGLAPSTVALVNRVAIESPVPVVLDADGLNALTAELGGVGLGGLADRKAATVLTPHPGELARLSGCSTAEIQADRPSAVTRAAKEARSVVALKGHQTLVGAPDGRVWVNPTGNPGMASGGSGDVLTGLMAGFLAQGHEAVDAARLAVFLHGAAGDLAAASTAAPAIAAGELLDHYPEALAGLRDG